MQARYGSTSSNILFGPDTTKLSLPAFTTLALPLTGAARNSTPRAASAARSLVEASTEIDVQSTTMRGGLGPDRRPSGPMRTCSRSWSLETIAKTMSRSARSASRSAMRAPCWASGSALARVRL